MSRVPLLFLLVTAACCTAQPLLPDASIKIKATNQGYVIAHGGAYAGMLTAGDQLVGAGDEEVSSKSFAKALASGLTKFVLPLVRATDEEGSEGDAHLLQGFIRVEVIQPTQLKVRYPNQNPRVVPIGPRQAPPPPPPAAPAPSQIPVQAAPASIPASAAAAAAAASAAANAAAEALAAQVVPPKVIYPGNIPGPGDQFDIIIAGAPVDLGLNIVGRPGSYSVSDISTGGLLNGGMIIPTDVLLSINREKVDELMTPDAVMNKLRSTPRPLRLLFDRVSKPPAVDESKNATAPAKPQAGSATAATPAEPAVAPPGPNEFDVTFPSEPMGVDLDAKAENITISEVAPTGPAAVGKVRPGDVAISVNGQTLLGMGFRAAVNLMVTSAWPRRVRFYRKPTVAVADPLKQLMDDLAQAAVVITSPDLLAGYSIPLSPALFGANLSTPEIKCRHDILVKSVTPVPACSPLMFDNMPPVEEGAPPSTQVIYGLTPRGSCSFAAKVFNIQQAGGGGAFILNTPKMELIAMPGGNTAEGQRVTVPSALLESKSGMTLSSAVALGRVIVSVSGNVNDCKADITMPNMLAVAAGSKLQETKGGRLWVWNGTHSDSTAFVSADFGPKGNASNIGILAFGNPAQGCLTDGQMFQNYQEVRNKVVILERGVCSFGVKAMNAQLAGAIAVIVVNTDANLFSMPVPTEEMAQPFVVPSVMVGPEFLQSPVMAGKGPKMIRLFRYAND